MVYSRDPNNEKKPKKENQFVKSAKYVIDMAKKGSPVHIAIIVGAVLVICLVIAGLVYLFTRGGDDEEENPLDMEYNQERDALDLRDLGPTILEETEDTGQEYIDGTLFIGDSNTVRTMMYGHTTWDNVVAAASMGVQHIETLKMTYFKGYKEPVTVPKAVEIIQPQRIIITYGTNNLLSYTPDKFIEIYKEGLSAIHEAYPYADIIINAIPPIDRERENINLTMQSVDKFNKALSEMARDEGYKYLNSSEALKDPDTGFAKKDFTIGDGVHLGKKGMDALFEYIRTHAYITEDRRPKPLKDVPEREETPTGIIKEDPLAVRGTRIRILFQSSDSSLGTVEGEIEQKLKRTVTSSRVTAVPHTREGGIFAGWTCNYDGLSSREVESVKYTVPKVGDDVTEIIITANFRRAELSITKDGSDAGSLSMNSGDTARLSARISPGFKGDSTVTWYSDNDNVVYVDGSGNVTAKSGGTANIYASILGGKISDSCSITVTQTLEGIKISGQSNIRTGSNTQLTLSAVPTGESLDASSASWTSDNNSVATVSRSGLVTGVSAGIANITAVVSGKSDTFTVTVSRYKPLTGISISASGPTSIATGGSVQLTVVYNPSDTTDDRTASWQSSDNSIATVSNGLVYGVRPGTVTITCTVGSFSATMGITVTAPAVTEPVPGSEAAPPRDSVLSGTGENLIENEIAPRLPISFLFIKLKKYID